MTRRTFTANAAFALAGTVLPSSVRAGEARTGDMAVREVSPPDLNVDFRYTPEKWQTLVCFPDDPHKSLVGRNGELLLDYAGRLRGLDDFSLVIGFTLAGHDLGDTREQRLEAPHIPVIHTTFQRDRVWCDLIAFATDIPGEGRVDNVVFDIVSRTGDEVHAGIQLTFDTAAGMTAGTTGGMTVVRIGSEDSARVLVTHGGGDLERMSPVRWRLSLEGVAGGERPARFVFRLPCDGQSAERVAAGLAEPEGLLATARTFWREWKPSPEPVSWSLPGRFGEFRVACARNILQARARTDTGLSFQVGPTIYRGLWIVDGHFLLEAARYLGYDGDAERGLADMWSRQRDDGAVMAGGGSRHIKETAIAIFAMIRQAELAGDWSYFDGMKPEVQAALAHIGDLVEQGRREDSASGRYGMLPMAFGDGGIGGIRSEFTNTLWTLAGLKALADTAAARSLRGFERAGELYRTLREGFVRGVAGEMRRHPEGFMFLPMIMKDDPQWDEPDPWDRPRLQTGQWALSHAIYPGLVFAPDDPVVTGHIRLLQWCTREDVPVETGWLPQEGLWTYGAVFAAHVYLWAGMPDLARRTFTGFLNHATPLYCWREEQPLQGSVYAPYVGDMPHNWASAECILYLRHMLMLEDGDRLRLLDGIGDYELSMGRPYVLEVSPTRFGRVSLDLQPGGGRAWRLRMRRGDGPSPGTVTLPAMLGRYALDGVDGAAVRTDGERVLVDPSAGEWTASWRT